MDKCPDRIPKDSADATGANEVYYNMKDGKEQDFGSDLLKYQGVDPDVSLPVFNIAVQFLTRMCA